MSLISTPHHFWERAVEGATWLSLVSWEHIVYQNAIEFMGWCHDSRGGIKEQTENVAVAWKMKHTVFEGSMLRPHIRKYGWM